MQLAGFSSPFGGQIRTRVLVELSKRDDCWPRELTRILETNINGVQQALAGLEDDGLVVPIRSVGRTVLYGLNPTYFAAAELRAYLVRLSEGYAAQGL